MTNHTQLSVVVLLKEKVIDVVKLKVYITDTGYKEDCVVEREDRLNGLFRLGFKNDRFLPLKSIGEDAKKIATDIESSFRQ